MSTAITRCRSTPSHSRSRTSEPAEAAEVVQGLCPSGPRRRGDGRADARWSFTPRVAAGQGQKGGADFGELVSESRSTELDLTLGRVAEHLAQQAIGLAHSHGDD